MVLKMKLQQRVERRKHQRFIKRLPAKIKTEQNSFLGITSDISENGLFLRTSRSFLPLTVLHMEITLPDNTVSAVKGIVKRNARMSVFSAKNGIGIELTEKDTAFRSLMDSVSGNTHEALAGRVIQESSEPDRSFSVGESRGPEQRPVTEYVQEKRRYKRFGTQETAIRCRLAFIGATDILNISMDGLKLAIHKGLSIGRPYFLDLHSGNDAIYLQGTVIWSFLLESRRALRGSIIPVYSAGIQFSEVKEEERKRIGDLIANITGQDGNKER